MGWGLELNFFARRRYRRGCRFFPLSVLGFPDFALSLHLFWYFMFFSIFYRKQQLQQLEKQEGDSTYLAARSSRGTPSAAALAASAT